MEKVGIYRVFGKYVRLFLDVIVQVKIMVAIKIKSCIFWSEISKRGTHLADNVLIPKIAVKI